MEKCPKWEDLDTGTQLLIGFAHVVADAKPGADYYERIQEYLDDLRPGIEREFGVRLSEG